MLDGSKDGHLKLDDFPNSKVDDEALPEIELETEIVADPPGAQWINIQDGKNIVRERWRWTAPGAGKRAGWNVQTAAWDEKVPWGAANVANSRRPQPHSVRSFDPPEEQAKQIHELLKTAVIDHARKIMDEDGTPAYQKLLDAVQAFQARAMDGAEAKIDDIEKRLNEIIAAIFLDHEVEYQQPTDTQEKSITLFPSAGRLLLGPKDGHKSAIEYQGSGTRRTLLWAALRILSEEKSSSGRPHVLLIDEPELCLHPNAIRDACKVLYDLAEREGWQVMVTTHSPVFIDLSRDNTSIVRVERTPDGINGITLFRPEQAALGADDKENLKLLNIFDPYVAEFFFGGKVVVVEGDTEYSAFKLITALAPKEFPDLHVIRARGKATIASLAKVLNHFGAGYAILHDSDAPTIEVKAKDGSIKSMANPAWTANSNILAVVKAAPKGARIRLVASVPNFEMAYFDYRATGEKPFTAVKNLREDADKRNIVAKLLTALTKHDSGLPEGALDWDDIDNLLAAAK